MLIDEVGGRAGIVHLLPSGADVLAALTPSESMPVNTAAGTAK